MKKYLFILSTFLLVTFLMDSALPLGKGPDDLIVGHSKKEFNL